MNIDIQKLRDFFFILNTKIMDFYCLCRIFKRYKNDHYFRPEESYNIIVYTGSKHTKVYNRFFERYINARKEYEYSSDKMLWKKVGCVKMPKSKIDFPFGCKILRDILNVINKEIIVSIYLKLERQVILKI